MRNVNNLRQLYNLTVVIITGLRWAHNLYCYLTLSSLNKESIFKTGEVSLSKYKCQNVFLENLQFYLIQEITEYSNPCLVHLQQPLLKLVKKDMVPIAGEELPLPDQNVFGLKVLFHMSSVETLVVCNNYWQWKSPLLFDSILHLNS